MKDEPEEARKQKNEYIKNIIALLNLCGDIALLDFIYRLLKKSI